MAALHLFLNVNFSLMSGSRELRSIVLFAIDILSDCWRSPSTFLSIGSKLLSLSVLYDSSEVKSRSENSYRERFGSLSV